MPPQARFSDSVRPAAIPYLTPRTADEQGKAQAASNRRFLGRLLVVTFGIVLAGGVVLAGIDWRDGRTDAAVRTWMNGPRTDPLVSIVLTAPTPAGPMMQASVQDPASLAYVSRLLPTASRQSQEPSG